MKIAEIKNAIIETCLGGDSKCFIPYLLDKKVNTGMPNKIRFYLFFKRMLKCSKENSVGNWILKIENYDCKEEKYLAYNFYDQVHKYARLTIIVKEDNKKIFFDTMPF